MAVQTRHALKERHGNTRLPKQEASKKGNNATKRPPKNSPKPNASTVNDAEKDTEHAGKPEHQSPAKPPKAEPASQHAAPTSATQHSADYASWRTSDLKDELRKRHLKLSGRPSEQVSRLKQSDHARSLPVKQEMEAAARKRRRDAEPDEPPARDGEPPMKKAKSSLDLAGSFAREEKLLRYGPPVYDHLGYEYDEGKIRRSFGSRPAKSTIMNNMDRALERRAEDQAAKWGIAFAGQEQPKEFRFDAFDDRVAHDLAIPYHKVESCDVEIWKARGFTAEAKEFERSNVSDEVRARLDEITCGCALRK
jgi:hypothetical protein